MTTKALQDVLKRIETWPEKDQEALAEFARVIEARRTGVYRLTEDERAAIREARQTALVPDDEADAYWKRYGIE
jgi:hypothetical protein